MCLNKLLKIRKCVFFKSHRLQSPSTGVTYDLSISKLHKLTTIIFPFYFPFFFFFFANAPKSKCTETFQYDLNQNEWLWLLHTCTHIIELPYTRACVEERRWIHWTGCEASPPSTSWFITSSGLGLHSWRNIIIHSFFGVPVFLYPTQKSVYRIDIYHNQYY